jgi:hypothetical protein
MKSSRLLSAMIAIICSAVFCLTMSSVVAIPVMLLAKFSFPEAGMFEILERMSRNEPKPGVIGLSFIIIELTLSFLLILLLFRLADGILSGFLSLGAYYIRIYKTFAVAFLILAWLLPTLWLFIPFNLILVAGLAAVLLTLVLSVTTWILRDMLSISRAANAPDGAAEEGARP